MAILRLKASTLMETLIASIIIFIIFVIAIEIINNVALRNDKQSHFKMRQEVNEIRYKASTNRLKLPFYQRSKDWDILVYREDEFKILELKILDTEDLIKYSISNENF
ncbi:hypothetical protein ACNKXS_13835 [Christiangramia marina]|uniref:hypothetical protein n=1 Tax=Christiangramia marina TaxID=409436 RepID=UPI003AA929FF